MDLLQTFTKAEIKEQCRLQRIESENRRNATAVNRKAWQEQKRRSQQRRMKHSQNVRNEIIDMHNLDYSKHMELG